MRIMLLCASLFLAFGSGLNAQTIDELKATKAEKEAQLGAIQAEVDALNGQINAFPGWKYGGLGVLGLNFSGNDNWYAIEKPFASSRSFGISAAGFAILDQEKYFWRNNLGVNLQQSFTKVDEDADDVEAVTDALDFSSLGGYKFTEKLAASAEAKYSSTLLQINDPGKLTASAGLTWLPIPNLVVIVHPLGYEKNFPGELVSATGAKLGASYGGTLIKGVSWSSNLSAFIPYTGGEATFTTPTGETVVDYGASDLMNWTWINGFSFSVWKGIGVGLNVGLRGDTQLADKYQYEFDGNEADDALQMYYNIGLSYTL